MSDPENQFMKPKNPWRWWAKALGERATPCNAESDRVALIRTILILQGIVANIFLIANVFRHW